MQRVCNLARPSPCRVAAVSCSFVSHGRRTGPVLSSRRARLSSEPAGEGGGGRESVNELVVTPSPLLGRRHRRALFFFFWRLCGSSPLLLPLFDCVALLLPSALCFRVSLFTPPVVMVAATEVVGVQGTLAKEGGGLPELRQRSPREVKLHKGRRGKSERGLGGEQTEKAAPLGY